MLPLTQLSPWPHPPLLRTLPSSSGGEAAVEVWMQARAAQFSPDRFWQQVALVDCVVWWHFAETLAGRRLLHMDIDNFSCFW